VLALSFLASGAARAQPLTVLPVTIQLAPGQSATTLTVINEGKRESSFQIRPYLWQQSEAGDIQLRQTEKLLASPPLGTIAPGGRQVVRLVLRQAPSGREATYRILVDQIPPPAAAGTVQVALRLSIPIFAPPDTRVAPHVVWRIEHVDGQAWLVAVNDGSSHLTVRDMVLRTAGGIVVPVDTAHVSPYVLAGTTRRWRLLGHLPAGRLRLTGNANNGAIDQQVQ
jgi:fimbrial chaperone protein